MENNSHASVCWTYRFQINQKKSTCLNTATMCPANAFASTCRFIIIIITIVGVAVVVIFYAKQKQ